MQTTNEPTTPTRELDMCKSQNNMCLNVVLVCWLARVSNLLVHFLLCVFVFVCSCPGHFALSEICLLCNQGHCNKAHGAVDDL